MNNYSFMLRRIIILFLFIYFSLFLFNSLSRKRTFTYDSMNYVDVARNISSGKGIAQSTLGFNQPKFSIKNYMPVPMTAQPPLFPIFISLLSKIGISYADSALIIPFLCYFAILCISFRITTILYGKSIAFIAGGLILLCRQLHEVGSTAWSEALGILFALLTFWIILNIKSKTKNSIWAFIAGITSGFAFATRYAMLSLIIACIIYMIIFARRSFWYHKFLIYIAGALIPFLLVVIRNYSIVGSFFPSANKSDVGIIENIFRSVGAIFGKFFGIFNPRIEAAMIIVFVILIFMLFLIRKGKYSNIINIISGGSKEMLVAWIVVYLSFLVFLRTRSHFDSINARLVSPVVIFILIILAAILFSSIKINGILFLAACLLISILIEVKTTIDTKSFDLQNIIIASERLKWISENTNKTDLIIGDHTVDIPFYFNGQKALSFSPYPYTNHPIYENILAYCRYNKSKYKAAYLILRRPIISRETYYKYYGRFFTDIQYKNIDKYKDIIIIAELEDAIVCKIETN